MSKRGDSNGKFATFIFVVITATYIVASVYPLEKANYLWLGWLWLGVAFLLSFFWRKWGE